MTQMVGSLQNRLMEQSLRPGELRVGDGATITMYSDRHAGTVIHVSPSGLTIKVQEDKHTRTDHNGMSESQSYSYERDTEAYVATFRWSEKRCRFTSGSKGLTRGRRHYYDYSF